MNKEHKAAQIAVLDCARHYAGVYKDLFWLLSLSTHARLIMHPAMKTVFSHKQTNT